jgi:D-alanyl-D-alanine carboxypeptidase
VPKPLASFARRSPSAPVRSLLIAAALALVASFMALPGASASGGAKIPVCGRLSTSGFAAFPARLPLLPPGSVPPPAILGQAAVVIDGDTGRVLYDLNAHERRAPASTTKIMTAILALEHGNLDRRVVSTTDGPSMRGSSIMGLQPGANVTLRDLLYGLMLPSGNDAGLEIGKAVDGDVAKFVDRMNRKVDELGLENTQFRNPHGLDARGHYSSAYDLAMLGRFAMRDPEFRAIARAGAWHVAPPGGNYTVYNTNSLLAKYPHADGVKMGFTYAAGPTLVASAVRDGQRLYATVLNSSDRDADAAALLEWAFNSYRWQPVGASLKRHLELAQKVGGGGSVVRNVAVCG